MFHMNSDKMRLTLRSTRRIKELFSLLVFFCLLSTVYSCNSNCRECARSAKMLSLEKEAERTFGTFLPCCTESCTGTGSITGISNSKCGIKKAGTKIVGGEQTNVNEYPWAVALANRDGSWAGCGGSLIASQWVLTAAHCLDTATDSNIAVIIGDHDLNGVVSGENRIVVNVNKVIKHESYNSNTFENDIALLRLATAVDLATHTPVCIPDTSAVGTFVNAAVQVYGWGTTSTGGSVSSVLLDTTVNVVSRSACNSAYNNQIKDGMLCAGITAGGKDACQGDSGGPLSYSVTSLGDRHQQIGVVSFGQGCALPNVPGVYAEVAFFRSWIECKLKDNGGAVFM